MKKQYRYRIIIIVSYVFLIIFSVILMVDLWNKLSLNTSVQIGNGLYLLVFAIVILASTIFILHLMQENRELHTSRPDIKLKDEPENNTVKQSAESIASPFDLDIDVLAGNIVPRIDPKESIKDYAERILLNLARHFEIVQGIIFIKNAKTQEFESLCTFAYASEKDPSSFKTGEGISGQVAKNKALLNLSFLPEGYLQIRSGLGKASPKNLLFIPLLMNKETMGIIELASFHAFDEETEWAFKNLAKIIGNAIITKIKLAEKK